MGRWEPDAAGRLRAAALELYVDRGFEQTTVAEIAQRAGLTARTFFRYFADKREVLFAGSSVLQERLVDALERAPTDAAPIDAVGAALDVAAALLGTDHGYSRKRQAVISAHADLQERDLIKLSALSAALAAALRDRNVDPTEASLVAELGVSVLKVAFERWVGEPEDHDLALLMRQALVRVRAVAAGDVEAGDVAGVRP